jgi:hypothetical protein
LVIEARGLRTREGQQAPRDRDTETEIIMADKKITPSNPEDVTSAQSDDGKSPEARTTARVTKRQTNRLTKRQTLRVTKRQSGN